ncbi:MAG: class II glutamine amidotransferase, partial [Cellulomonadaceae bacterium]|nr:class II glutamine amidotransferase [Cellulomonadaceae bacterium]
MCGIVGYTGRRLDGVVEPSQRPLEVAMEGLKRLEYRGYDSAGVAVASPEMSAVAWAKKAGKLENLRAEIEEHPLPDATAVIAHTRWATHGGPTDKNAHPHVVNNGRLAVIHNGILENFAALKAELVAEGVEFVSQTDTEVGAQLIAKAYNECGDLTQAMRQVVGRLKGTYTLLALHVDDPLKVVGARHDSPLVVGIGEGENFLGSDVAAFIAYTDQAMELDQDQIVTVTPDSVSVIDF